MKNKKTKTIITCIVGASALNASYAAPAWLENSGTNVPVVVVQSGAVAEVAQRLQCVAADMRSITIPGFVAYGNGSGTCYISNTDLAQADYASCSTLNESPYFSGLESTACKADDGSTVLSLLSYNCPGLTDSVGAQCTVAGESMYYAGQVDGRKIVFGLADDAGAAYWGTYNFTTGATSNSDGASNTTDIAAHVENGDGSYNPDDGYSSNASLICQEKGDGWYLPSKDELNLNWSNRASIGLSSKGWDTSGAYYWSSTEYTFNDAWNQRFSDGYQNATGYKDNNGRVRCARSL